MREPSKEEQPGPPLNQKITRSLPALRRALAIKKLRCGLNTKSSMRSAATLGALL